MKHEFLGVTHEYWGLSDGFHGQARPDNIDGWHGQIEGFNGLKEAGNYK